MPMGTDSSPGELVEHPDLSKIGEALRDRISIRSLSGLLVDLGRPGRLRRGTAHRHVQDLLRSH